MVTKKQSQKPFKRLLLTMSAMAALVTAATAQNTGPTQQQAQYEIWFMQNMIDHHTQAIQMANLAASRTENPYILQASASLVSNDTAEVGTLQNWLSSWYGINYQPSGDSGSVSYLSSLSGPAFDYAWVQAMTQHERASMAAARAAQGRAWHWDLQAAARSIANTDFSRVQTMRAWMQAPVSNSYSVNGPGPNVSPLMSPWTPGMRAYMGSSAGSGAIMNGNVAIAGNRAMSIGGANISPWIPGMRAYMGSASNVGTLNGPSVATSSQAFVPGRRAYMGGRR